MEMKKIRNIVLGLTLLTLVATVSFKLGQESSLGTGSGQNGELNLALMWKVKGRLKQLFLDKDKMDDKKMMYGAVEGMVASLDDPYTVFLPPKENKASSEDLKGEFGGVGISLGYKDKTLAVMTPLAKSPAEAAGVKAGDLILKISDKKKKIERETNNISLNEAVELIRGEVGTEVTLKMFREGKGAAYDVTLKRDNIVVPSLELEWVGRNKQASVPENKEVAWIKMYKFSDRIYKEWPDFVEQIRSKDREGRLAGMVLDLRNNPGGFLQASVLVASDFLKEGVVVKQESSDGKVETYEVDKGRRNLTEPKLVVLINGGSASAAEILAGALHDHGRAKLVGEKSFGKGTVQQPEDFADGSGLHVTIARWLLPSGKNIHKEGVNPDVEVKFEEPKLTGTPTPMPAGTSVLDNQVSKAIEVLMGK
jgi:carboxyl-terminal processing protease